MALSAPEMDKLLTKYLGPKALFALKMMEISPPKGHKRMQNDIFRKMIKLSHQTELQNFVSGHLRS